MTGNMERDRERVEREGDEVVRNIEEDEDEDRISNSLLPCVFNSPVITGEREVGVLGTLRAPSDRCSSNNPHPLFHNSLSQPLNHTSSRVNFYPYSQTISLVQSLQLSGAA